MSRKKRKLTPAEKAEKKRRKLEFMTVFINGKQKRVKRPPTIDGLPMDEFIRRNADPIWLLQNEMYAELYQWEQENLQLQQGEKEQEDFRPEPARDSQKADPLDDNDVPF